MSVLFLTMKLRNLLGSAGTGKRRLCSVFSISLRGLFLFVDRSNSKGPYCQAGFIHALILFIIEKGRDKVMTNVHIGNIIRRKLAESPMSIAEFAERINRTRPTVYDIFNRKSIDVDLLLKISEVLDYNFLEEVYVKKEGGDTVSAPAVPRYIVGRIVSENELKDYPIAQYPVRLKVVKR